MIIKSIIFILISIIIQLNAINWFNVLFFSSIIGIGSNSYKQSFYLGFIVGFFPWLFQFIIQLLSTSLSMDILYIIVIDTFVVHGRDALKT